MNGEIVRMNIAGLGDQALIELRSLVQEALKTTTSPDLIASGNEILAIVGEVMAERGIEAADDAQADTGADG